MLIMSQYILELWCSRDFQKSHCSIPVGTLVLSSSTLSGTYCTHDSTIIRLLFLNHIIFFSLARNDSSFTLVSGQIRIYISTERRKPYAFWFYCDPEKKGFVKESEIWLQSTQLLPSLSTLQFLYLSSIVSISAFLLSSSKLIWILFVCVIHIIKILVMGLISMSYDE